MEYFPYLSMQRTSLLITCLFVAGHTQGTCPQFSLSYPPNGTYSCPGSNITYTCVLKSSNANNIVITAWTGLAFLCLANGNHPENQIPLTQKSGGVLYPNTSGTCGSLSAVTTNISPDGTCYTSVLTIPAVQALNGATVVCTDGNTLTVVGSDTLKITTSPGPVGTLTLNSPSVDNLTVAWAPPTTGGVPTSYSVSINDGSNTSVTISALQNTFTGLTSDTLYTVSVVAINCAGTSNVTSQRNKTRSAPSKWSKFYTCMVCLCVVAFAIAISIAAIVKYRHKIRKQCQQICIAVINAYTGFVFSEGIDFLAMAIRNIAQRYRRQKLHKQAQQQAKQQAQQQAKQQAKQQAQPQVSTAGSICNYL